MTEPLFPLPDLTVLVQPVAAVFAAYGAAKIGTPLVRRARQGAFDDASAAEAVSLVVSAPPGLAPPRSWRSRSSGRSIHGSGAASTPGGSVGRRSS
jgi:hypothetical protein